MLLFLYTGSYDDIAEKASIHNVRMYALAEKYSIPGLKELAFSKVTQYDWEDWCDELLEIVKIICETTPVDDRLRGFITKQCAQQAKSLIQKDEFAWLIEHIGGFALHFTREYSKNAESCIQRFENEARKQTEDVEQLKATNREIRLLKGKAEAQLAELMELFKHESCSNCDHEFPGLLEFRNGTLALQCPVEDCNGVEGIRNG